MRREIGSLIAISIAVNALTACVGPQYDAAPDFGEDAAFASDTDTEGDTDTSALEELCPDLASNGNDIDAARTAFVEGLSAYVGEHYADAALAFCRAHAAKPHYAIMYNIAKCETELGDVTRAIAAYKRFLDESRGELTEDRRREVLDEIARLRRAPTLPSPR
jgi:hypothetical protein